MRHIVALKTHYHVGFHFPTKLDTQEAYYQNAYHANEPVSSQVHAAGNLLRKLVVVESCAVCKASGSVFAFTSCGRASSSERDKARRATRPLAKN